MRIRLGECVGRSPTIGLDIYDVMVDGSRVMTIMGDELLYAYGRRWISATSMVSYILLVF